ncbi:uncharacterized protein LOC119597418 [Penaeus monodon]|uniref:uncharacterized protein LOC119597418 n=1 Tax=Penaeus monodon TaxID=6687 RepID=UPI0018A799B6|nr:uncharacterized protein LOC119597418 [Penaeus monodon]
MKWIFVVLGVFVGAAWGAPVAEEPLLVVVEDDAQQSLAIINADQQQPFVPIEIPEDNNFRYLTRDFEGATYQFGYNTGNTVDENGVPQANMYRHEMRRQDGTVVGRYGYVDPEGVERTFNYVVDEDGYRLLEAGDLLALDVVEETPQDEEEANKARLDLPLEEQRTPIALPVIPEGATDLSRDAGTYGYITVL